LYTAQEGRFEVIFWQAMLVPVRAAAAVVLTRRRGHAIRATPSRKLVRPKGFEPLTFWSVARCSIQLSYGRTDRVSLAEREGFEPSVEFLPHIRLAGVRLRPLGHLSGACRMAEGGGFEPPWGRPRRFSRPLPYQLGLALRCARARGPARANRHVTTCVSACQADRLTPHAPCPSLAPRPSRAAARCRCRARRSGCSAGRSGGIRGRRGPGRP
jgi:hypothetical protein